MSEPETVTVTRWRATSESHPNCTRPDGHVCQEPSGRPCYEPGCDRPAGTHWGPYWCPEHDAERLDRITAQLESLKTEVP